MNVLGISAFYHDSAAALVRDGQLLAAAQEERFSRRKHDDRFPINAIRYCLQAGGVAPGGLDAVVYYDTHNRVTLHSQLHFPHSLGLLYSAFTYYCGFRVNSGEYKLMGLAPYGEPRYADLILDELLDLREDGSFRMNMRYFGYVSGLEMTNRRFERLFGGPPRKPESEITRREMDLARSIQDVTEEVVLRIARHAASTTGQRNACLAGGVALNCVANGRLLREGPFERIWVQPAAGDAGGAVGAALHGWYQITDHPRSPSVGADGMSGAYLGPEYPDEEIERYLRSGGYPYERVEDEGARAHRIAQLVADGKVVGLFTGRMEFGPRALGHRSILGDARSPDMQSTMNLKIKYRESFRPFAPAILADRAAEYFDLDVESPYMMLVAPVRADLRRANARPADDLRVWVNEARSEIPAVTHVDYSARLQTVNREQSPHFHSILSAFDELTGCPVMINTSFNVRGEPIVCTPEDAYRCFMRTEMDHLVLGSQLLDKADQPAWTEGERWREDLVLD